MRVLIVEDEQRAASKLTSTLQSISPSIEILEVLESVSSTIAWLQNHPLPDLIFLDIQLGDGVSFEIFEVIQKPIPIVFITAFDNYLLQAFQLNSVDYILKPFNTHQIQKALDKFSNIQSHTTPSQILSLLDELKIHFKKNYKSRFFVKQNNALYSVSTEDIIYFESTEGYVILVNAEHRKFVIDYTLEDLETCLDPSQFFRATRQLLINYHAIKKMVPFGQGRIQVQLDCPSLEPFLISRGRTKDFRNWLDR